jgi:hypothetical protein
MLANWRQSAPYVQALRRKTIEGAGKMCYTSVASPIPEQYITSRSFKESDEAMLRLAALAAPVDRHSVCVT